MCTQYEVDLGQFSTNLGCNEIGTSAAQKGSIGCCAFGGPHLMGTRRVELRACGAQQLLVCSDGEVVDEQRFDVVARNESRYEQLVDGEQARDDIRNDENEAALKHCY